jgi:hypothetical protein
MEGTGGSLPEVLLEQLPGGTEENHELRLVGVLIKILRALKRYDIMTD